MSEHLPFKRPGKVWKRCRQTMSYAEIPGIS